MLRFDLISIFPEYLQPLKLSLLGKAADKGLLQLIFMILGIRQLMFTTA